MGTIQDNLFGHINGRVGNTVYYTLRGKRVARHIGKNNAPPTIKQQASRQGMKVINAFLKPISWPIRLGFGLEAEEKNMYPQNVAVGYNKRHALKGEYPNVEMNYEKALVSRGLLRGLEHPAVSLEEDGAEELKLNFSWTVLPEDQEWPRATDTVMLLAFFPEDAGLAENGEPVAGFNLNSAKRNTGSDVLKLPAGLKGRAMEIYIAVVAEDRKMISDSQYLGRILQ